MPQHNTATTSKAGASTGYEGASPKRHHDKTKKAFHGGKWGRELNEHLRYLYSFDLQSPFRGEDESNYDAEENGDYELSGYIVHNSNPLLDLPSFKEQASKLVDVYFKGSHDEQDCGVDLQQLQCRVFHDELVALTLRKAMDGSDEHRKLAMKLIGALFEAELLSASEGLRGVDKIIMRMDDLVLDVPSAPKYLLEFLHDMTCCDPQILSNSVLARLPETLMQTLVSLSEKYRLDETDSMRIVRENLEYLPEYKKEVGLAVQEYFNSENNEEVGKILNELDHRGFRYEVVRRAILISLDREDRERELICQLLCQLNAQGVIVYEDLITGFTRLIFQADDMKSDWPRIVEWLAKFIARGLIDEILPPAFLQNCLRLNIGGATGKEICDAAAGVVQRPDALEACQAIWGEQKPSRALGSTEFRQELRNLINEYFHSHDIDEVARLVTELGLLPHQKAVLVRKVMTNSMDGYDTHMSWAFKLIKGLHSDGCLSLDDIEKGFDQMFSMIQDLKLDTPDVDEIADLFMKRAIRDEILRREYVPPEPLPVEDMDQDNQ